jgi:dihydrodipicolinate synthase/N-acetylneuraminate lyase
MLSASELNGVLGMMPAFATPDAIDIRATQTIAIDNLKDGVDKIIKDGVNNIATTGTYGECYNLLFEEFKTLAVATLEAVKKKSATVHRLHESQSAGSRTKDELRQGTRGRWRAIGRALL